MYVQFSFFYRLQSLGYQRQLNRVTTQQEHQIYNARLNLHNSTPIKKMNQSSTDTNLSTSMRPVSSATRVCTCPTSRKTLVCMWPICIIMFKDKFVSADIDQSPQIHLDLEQNVTEYYSFPRSSLLNELREMDNVHTL